LTDFYTTSPTHNHVENISSALQTEGNSSTCPSIVIRLVRLQLQHSHSTAHN